MYTHCLGKTLKLTVCFIITICLFNKVCKSIRAKIMFTYYTL